MRNLKKFAAMALAAVMCMAMAVPASAAAAGTRTYDVFQIFTGQYAEGDGFDGMTLSNVRWGVNGTGETKTVVDPDILAELEAIADGFDQTAVNEGSINRNRLAVILKYADLEGDALKAGLTVDQVNGLELDDGYYLIRDNGPVGDGEALSIYSVLVTGGKLGFAPKSSNTPDLEKKVVAGDGASDRNNVALGNTVKFRVTSTLPDNMHDYQEYYWVLTDTLSEGLIWAGCDSVTKAVITIGGEDVSILDELYVSPGKDKNGSVLIGLQNVLALIDVEDPDWHGPYHEPMDISLPDDEAGELGDNGFAVAACVFDNAVITIEYEVTVDPDKAAIASDANTNEVVLTYSNDPNNSGDGRTKNDPDNPPETPNPTGKTVKGEKTRTETWITALTVELFTKRDWKPLPGAEFVLTGENLNVVIKYSSDFVSDPDGDYWKLKDGGFTNVAPIEGETDDQYEAGGDKYRREDTLVTKSKGSTSVTGTIDDNGQLTFTGLPAGDYVLTNTKIDNGYNLADPVEFTISFSDSIEGDFDTPGHLFSSDNEIVEERTPEWFYVTLLVDNGTLLPETGGMGTAALTVGGICLIAAAGAMLVLKKRRGAAE